jgi:hypothetical protein
MRKILSFTLLALFVLLPVAMTGQIQSERNIPYPNELPHFKLYEKAKWKELQPLISTEEDVHRILGDVRASYEFDPDWLILLSFVGKGSSTNGRLWPESLTGRVSNIMLRPRKRISFKKVVFPATFKKGYGSASHTKSAWHVYSDGSGLQYYIFSNKVEGHEVGDLYKIEYGASEALINR